MKFSKWRLAGVALGLVFTALGAVAFPFSGAGAKDGSPLSHRKAKNVILLIGDGMGAAHREAIRLATQGLNGTTAMDSLPYSGLVHTHSDDPNGFITDSAAAATAIATGVKTYNGAIGVDANGKPVETVLEAAKRAGKSTGLVTTSQVTDATPAAFAAHVKDRSEQSEIARQFIENSRVDVILGGGEDYWYPSGDPGKFPDNPAEDPSEASKGTKGNLVAQAKQLGYTYVSNEKELNAAKGNKLLGLFANEEMFQQRPEGEGDLYNPRVSLPDMTKKAIDTLSKNKKGFFLVVEEEAIDEMSHENNAALMIQSGQAFDRAVAVAKSYTQRHPDTLVIATADHDCGGLAIEAADNSDESGDGKTISSEDGPFPIAHTDKKFYLDWTTTGHTGVDVPLTAMGPGAAQLIGVYENTYIHDAIWKALGLHKSHR